MSKFLEFGKQAVSISDIKQFEILDSGIGIKVLKFQHFLELKEPVTIKHVGYVLAAAAQNPKPIISWEEAEAYLEDVRNSDSHNNYDAKRLLTEG